MPGEACPWKKTWSPPSPSSLPRKKWLKPTSYRDAEEAKVAMWPPTPIPGRCARETITAAFQRVALRILRSISSLPGKNGSLLVGMVLT